MQKTYTLLQAYIDPRGKRRMGVFQEYTSLIDAKREAKKIKDWVITETRVVGMCDDPSPELISFGSCPYPSH